MERTYVMLKPDAYERGLMGEIISRIERKTYKIVDVKMINLEDEILKLHYAHLVDKPFFGELVAYLKSGPVLAMIVEGYDVVNGMRTMCGPTASYEALPGSIRGDYSTSKQRNLVHASDSVESAEAEIKRFFS